MLLLRSTLAEIVYCSKALLVLGQSVFWCHVLCRAAVTEDADKKPFFFIAGPSGFEIGNPLMHPRDFSLQLGGYMIVEPLSGCGSAVTQNTAVMN